MTVFIGNSVKAEHRFLGAPSAKTKSALRQGVILFRLCPREAAKFRFSFCNSFTREACNDLAQQVKVDVFEGVWIKAFPYGFSRFTASNACAKVSVSVCS